MNPTAIIEVTENCNLGCTFCLRPSFTPPIMSFDTLEEIVSHIIEVSDKRADFVWHGGEPLIAGLDFFKRIPLLQNKYNTRNIDVRNNVQTNATLLDKKYIEFFQKNNFSIGTSIQGTKETHDSSRVTLGGGPTYEKVMEKISFLKEKPSSIVVLTTELLGKEEDIYYGIKPKTQGLRISEYFPGGLNPSKRDFSLFEGRPEPLMPIAEEWGKSMIHFYEIWKNDPNPVDLRPITEIIRSFVVGKSDGCLYSQEACNHSVIGVKVNGEFYTCIRGAHDQQFSIGFVDEKPLKKYIERSGTDKQKRINKLLEGSCGSCKFWNYCNGGCPLESWKIYGDLDHKTWYCKGRKMLFQHILNDLS
ncbi:MAG: radical SAM protein [Nanoarchaeota archaeon]